MDFAGRHELLDIKCVAEGQVADVGKTTGGSPWDEPAPENTTTKKPTPTVVGDLDVTQKQLDSTGHSTLRDKPSGSDSKSSPQAAATAEQKPMELKIPADTDEKVGAKVDPVPAATVPAVAPTQAPMSQQNAQSSEQKPPTDQIHSIDSTSSPQASSGQSAQPTDFWQSVYGQTDNPAAAAAINNSTTTQPRPDIIPAKPIVQSQPVVANPASADTNHLYQPAPTNTTPAPQTPTSSAQASAAPQPAAEAQTPVSQPANMPAGRVANRTKTFVIAGILGLIILFAGGVFLTEKGLISIGLEKVYGAVHLEALWGGLPANAENAFAMSAVQMKSEPSFKISGNATITVNKSVKSNLISPIISAAAFPIVSFQDEQIGPKIKAVLTAVSDQTAASNSSDLFQDDSSPASDQSTSSSDSSSSSSSTTTTPSTTDTTPSSGFSTTTDSNSTIEQLSTNISAQITNTVSGADINIKSSKSANSEIQLVYSQNKMYLKTSSDIIYDSQAKGSWVSFNLNKFGTDSPGQSFFGNSFSGSNFSIIGNRGNGETINGVRCFHYTGKATIGTALQSFGLTNNSVSSLDFDYWLGTSDHLIHRLAMKIIPGSESAVSRIDMTIDFSNYGNNSADFLVPASSLPFSGLTSTTAVDLSTAQSRDAKRKTDLASIAKGLESYHSAQGKYPQAAVAGKILPTSGTLYSSLIPTYLASLPIDPNDPTNYYGYESNGTTYKLSSVLEDKTDTSGKQVGSNFLYFLSSL
ncbi:MAG: hypothetical protein NTY30_00240 [Candidatus Berkelbacteria bacterium]|nr:hypothetical protein [Candidatus Berkelbacteria bacterium]